MAFRFLCPRGHLLQGDESQTGQRCKCPYCHSQFLVPQASGIPRPDHLPVASALGGDAPSVDDPARAQPAAGPPEPPPDETVPEIRTGGKVGTDSPAEVAAQLGLVDAQQRDLLHIACPKGHVLETPREMLGQRAMCPYCQAEFRLRLEDSQEHRRQTAERRQRQEQKLGKAWMHRAIVSAVLVILALVLMIAMAVWR